MGKLCQLLEDALLGKVIGAMLDGGFRVVVSDQDGGGLYVYGIAANGEKVRDGKYDYWVRLVPGNGASFISDYSTNLETTLKPVNDFAALLDD